MTEAVPEPQVFVNIKQSGFVRTDMSCHSCSHNFYALLDFDLNGDHEVECPWCGHIHYRKIADGFVTESRYSYDPRSQKASDTDDRNVWKAKTVRIAAAPTAALLLRDLWLRRSDQEDV